VVIGEAVGLEAGDGDEEGVDAGVAEAQTSGTFAVQTTGWASWQKTVSPMIGP